MKGHGFTLKNTLRTKQTLIKHFFPSHVSGERDNSKPAWDGLHRPGDVAAGQGAGQYLLVRHVGPVY